MRLFIWSLILTVILLVGFVEIATTILPPPVKKQAFTLPVHRTVYVDRNVYEDQFFHITEAALEWNQATDGQVIFDVKKLPQHNIIPSESVIISDVSPDFPEIILLDNLSKHNTLGLFNGNKPLASIYLVEARISDDDSTAVVLHELGHYLGLEHPDSEEHPEIGIGSLMYSSIDLGSNHITEDDLKQFCRLYHCDWRKFHGVPQVQ